MEITLLIIGLAAGLVFGWLLAMFKAKSNTGKIEERASILEQGRKETEANLSNERNKVIELNKANSSLESENKNLVQKLAEQKVELENIQKKFVNEFENLANKIFEDKSTKFTQQNQEKLNSIINPLNEKIKEFQKRVEETYDKESKQRFSLEKEIKSLYELNMQMSKDAQNLTTALKGQTKTQGNWGEFILESILEKSGLVKGREYLVQESITVETGRRFQPDVVIKLPENKSIIIDSKVSLVGYEKFVTSEDEHEKQLALREHIHSIKAHIKNLGSKNYQNLYQLESLDFVLMFMPIEPAFAFAVQTDSSLFTDAFEQNIVIVSPSTLLATLRTIASIWRQENQNKNAIEIARQSGALYDKFVGFLDDLKSVGDRLDQAKGSYDNAWKKIKEGTGNLISRAEKIKKLGAKTSKSLPQSILNGAEKEDEND